MGEKTAFTELLSNRPQSRTANTNHRNTVLGKGQKGNKKLWTDSDPKSNRSQEMS